MRENIYLAFRGAGARAVLAGVRSPVGSLYYAHANIYIARRAAMPWLDVDSTELFTVADAISVCMPLVPQHFFVMASLSR